MRRRRGKPCRGDGAGCFARARRIDPAAATAKCGHLRGALLRRVLYIYPGPWYAVQYTVVSQTVAPPLRFSERVVVVACRARVFLRVCARAGIFASRYVSECARFFGVLAPRQSDIAI